MCLVLVYWRWSTAMLLMLGLQTLPWHFITRTTLLLTACSKARMSAGAVQVRKPKAVVEAEAEAAKGGGSKKVAESAAKKGTAAKAAASPPAAAAAAKGKKAAAGSKREAGQEEDEGPAFGKVAKRRRA